MVVTPSISFKTARHAIQSRHDLHEWHPSRRIAQDSRKLRSSFATGIPSCNDIQRRKSDAWVSRPTHLFEEARWKKHKSV